MIKNIAFLLSCILLILILGACGSPEEKKDQTTGNNDSVVPKTEAAFVFDSTTINDKIKPDKKLTTYKGTFLKAVEWTDINGENILILSQKEAYVTDKDEETRKAEFYGICYLKKTDAYEKQWEISDFVDQCWCDCDVTLQENTLKITDIDKDGIAENLFIYVLNDRCDVGPVQTKLMMHSGVVKLVVRGYSQQYFGPSEKEMNEFRKEQGLKSVKFKELDPEFDKHNDAFKNYASAYWDNYIKQENDKFKKEQLN
jgi:hypothetical protein